MRASHHIRSLLLLALSFAATLCLAQQPPGELPDGLMLAIELEQSVRTDRAKVGDPVRAKLVAPVLMRGAIAIPSGAKVTGVVEDAEPLAAGKPSRLRVRFREVKWRDGTQAVNAYPVRQLVIKRTYQYASREFCPPVDRFLPQSTAPQNQQPSPPQQPSPTPAPTPPPVYVPPQPPPMRYPETRGSDLCHSPTGTRRGNVEPLVFKSPAISGVTIRKVESPAGAMVIESTTKNVSLSKGTMLEIRHVAP
jgi:hypothetical protein